MFKKLSFLIIYFLIIVVGTSALLFNSSVPPQNATGAPGHLELLPVQLQVAIRIMQPIPVVVM